MYTQISYPFAWFYWDPPREAFRIPFFDHPVAWYGILFVTGFILGYFLFISILSRFLNYTRHLASIDIQNGPQLSEILQHSSDPFCVNFRAQASPLIFQQDKSVLLEQLNAFIQKTAISRVELEQIFAGAIVPAKQTAYFLTDRLCWFAIAGTLIGARLGIVFLYDWPYFSRYPLEIFKVWHGGLASHGGVLGVLLALYLYYIYVRKWMPQLTFVGLLDKVSIPSALVACFIRLGNFMNQEILGIQTDLPWGVIFGHATEDNRLISRHPVQLYEAGAYFLTFLVLWRLWKKQAESERPGVLVGLMFILIFGSRFILEFWKTNQDAWMNFSTLQLSQWLNIPLILLGLYFFIRATAPTKK